jgi:hypothetical protein
MHYIFHNGENFYVEIANMIEQMDPTWCHISMSLSKHGDSKDVSGAAVFILSMLWLLSGALFASY